MKTITNEEYLELAGNGRVTLIDVREPDEFAAGHAPGAVNIPLAQVGDRADEIPAQGDVYIMCRSGGRAGRAIEALESQGRTNTIRVAPGMGDWNGPVEN
ncbi:rhodanese-like domain-containing protein [Bhargavaea ullalensis]|uniref:Rhodanese-related sulfurtransferase n=1 Tax=Bhargavaea ullalensis TaxID=1265685 RepID=A0ABV2GB02_9BACL